MRTTPTEKIRQGVTDTLLDYCQFVDEKRLDEFADLFSENCVFDEGAPKVISAPLSSSGSDTDP